MIKQCGLQCPECGWGLKNDAGLASHRWFKHGIRSDSAAARERRRKRSAQAGISPTLLAGYLAGKIVPTLVSIARRNGLSEADLICEVALALAESRDLKGVDLTPIQVLESTVVWRKPQREGSGGSYQSAPLKAAED